MRDKADRKMGLQPDANKNCNIRISTTSRELPSKEFWNKRKQ